MSEKILNEIEEKIGYHFQRRYLLIQAFTRSSFAHEHSGWVDNEGLEFVGDKVIDFIVVKKLAELTTIVENKWIVSYDAIVKGKKIQYEDIIDEDRLVFFYTEGEMTEIKKSLVKQTYLAKVAETLGIEKYLLMGKGDVKNNVDEQFSVKEDLIEAILGAIAIDCNWNMLVIEEIVDRFINLTEHIKNGDIYDVDYVSCVQNWFLKKYGRNPEYDFYDEQGYYECSLYIGDECFEGTSRSKKEAMEIAAMRAYGYIQRIEKNANTIKNLVGEFNEENAITKLQMLLDKRIIKDVRYVFAELPADEDSNGNPIWSCYCVVEGVSECDIASSYKKILAKKEAAYYTLSALTKQYEYIDGEIRKIL